MNALSQMFLPNKDVQSIISGVEVGLSEQLVAGLSGSSRAMLIASVYKKTNRSILVVTYNLLQAQKQYLKSFEIQLHSSHQMHFEIHCGSLSK